MSRNWSVRKAPVLALLALGALVGTAGLAGCGGSSNTENNGSAPPSKAPAAGGASTAGGAGGTAGGGKALQIAVIPKGTTHEFWKSIHAGALKAQQDLSSSGTPVEIKWQGPLQENDKNSQINIVETFVQQKVDGIVLAPLDADALVRPVEEAQKSGVPVVIIDSALKTDKYVSFVATDNEKGGVLAGEQLAKLLNGKGRVLMMRYEEGSASTMAREAGFLKAIQKYPGLKILSDDQYAGATVETAYSTGQNLVTRFGKQIDGLFTPNESSTRGMLRALKDAGLKPRYVGFDASKDLVESLKAGDVQALIVQNPFLMGEQGVKTMVQAIHKQAVPKRIDTGVTVVTAANMNQPDIAKLLNPPLEQYLGQS